MKHNTPGRSYNLATHIKHPRLELIRFYLRREFVFTPARLCFVGKTGVSVMAKQFDFEERSYKHDLCHGGSLRQKKLGRKSRPLSTKDPIHLVFKANMGTIRGGLRQSRRYALIHHLIRKYAKHFYVKIDKFSVQNDHIHLLIHAPRRAKYQHFFRVLAGQIAQQFHKHGLVSVAMTDTPHTPKNAIKKLTEKIKKLWRCRPYTRVVKGYRAYKTVLAYVELNELEALGIIPYREQRLRGLGRDALERLRG